MRTLIRIPEESDFTSPLRHSAVAARVGSWLGICFAVAFVTGLLSHAAQSPTPWIPLPTRPTWGYQVTQGLHIAAGTAAVPLLLVKLWTVYPRLFARIPRPGAGLLLHAAERGSILVLVASAIFLLASGLANAAQWYPWDFRFRATHFALAWTAIGALLVHVAVKLPQIRQAWSEPVEEAAVMESRSTLSRRGLLRATWTAAGAVVVLTAGATVPWLRQVSLFAVRSGEGPQGIPVNKSAAAAGVVDLARSPAYRLVVTAGSRSVTLSRDDLAALPQHSVDLPIACVEGWSATGTWTGVRMLDLMALVGRSRGDVRVTSLQGGGPFRASTLPTAFAEDPLTLLALSLNGEPLHLDHGYPARLIAPNRPGVLQTKWVTALEVEA